MTSQSPDLQFWNFSQKVYAAPGVHQECLDLQDNFGVDINLLLFCVYAGACCKISLSNADIAAIENLVMPWRVGVIMTVRNSRRTMKSAIANLKPDLRTAAEALRTKIKAIELEGEYFEQQLLTEWLAQEPKKLAREDTGLIEGNVRRVFQLIENKANSRAVRYPSALDQAARGVAAANNCG
jgi:uncharacterized protein (TIGR02444 family)